MDIKTFFDSRTYTMTYVVFDMTSKDAVIIDPVLDYEPWSSKVWTESSDEAIDFITSEGLHLHFILETHAHADHLSGAQHIKDAFPDAMSVIGEPITQVQALFKGVFDLPDTFATDGSQFDVLLQPGEQLRAGALTIEAIPTPGHTPACMTYKIDDALFTGDALFMPDVGTGRCDFPGGSSSDLYHSIKHNLYTLPDAMRVFVGHDYPEGRGREIAYETTIGKSKLTNVAITAHSKEVDYIEWRDRRDRNLAAPKLLFQSVQVNIDAGHLPASAQNKVRYLKIPINVFKPPINTEEGLELKES